MRVDRHTTLEDKLEDILKASQAAQKAAESANSFLFWMNIGWYARIIFQIAVVVALVVFGWYVLREVRSLAARLPAMAANVNLPRLEIPVDVSVNVNVPLP